MKRTYLIMLPLFFVVVTSVNAQIAIGNQDGPHKGAVLDLKSSSNKGLLLPKVELNMNDLTEFVLDGVAERTTADGMVVYNTSDQSQGIYYWDGEKWNALMDAERPEIVGYAPVQPRSPISLSFNGSVIFTINVANVSEELVYDWYVENSGMFFDVSNILDLSPPQGTGTKITKTTGTFEITHGEATEGDLKWAESGIPCSYWYVYCVVSLKSNPKVKVTSDYFLMKRGWSGSCPI